MSEYCYRCVDCGRFKEDCICDRFNDPMEPWRSMSSAELMDDESELEEVSKDE